MGLQRWRERGSLQDVQWLDGERQATRKPVVSLKGMVGCYGKATTPLAPNGYVRVEGELWWASSTGPNIDEGDEIVIVDVKRLTLFVALLPNNRDIIVKGGEFNGSKGFRSN